MNLVSLKKIAEDKAQTTIGIKKVTDYALDPRSISIEPGFNGRDMVNMSPRTRAHVDRIKAAIRAGTVMPPLDVRVSGDKIYVVEGHCRLVAYRELIAEGVEILFVSVRQFNGNDEDRDFHVVNSSSQLHLTRLEQGRIYARRVSHGWSIARIAERAMKSITYVEQNLMLINANSDVHRLLEDETVSAKVALDAIRKYGDQAGAFLTEKLAKANGEGKTKLTQSVVKGRAIPQKVIKRFTASLSAFVDTLSPTLPHSLESMRDDVGVMVPAGALRALLAAHADIQRAAPKEAEREQVAA